MATQICSGHVVINRSCPQQYVQHTTAQVHHTFHAEEPAVPKDIKNDDTQLVNNLINQGQAGQLTSSTQDLETSSLEPAGQTETSSQSEWPAGHTDGEVHLTSQDPELATLPETSQSEGPAGHTDGKVHLTSQDLGDATLPETYSQSGGLAGHTDGEGHLTSQDPELATLPEISSQSEGPAGHTNGKVHLTSQDLGQATLPETYSQKSLLDTPMVKYTLQVSAILRNIFSEPAGHTRW